jgi:hypothetical protein
MSIDTASRNDLDTMTVLDGALTAIKSSPLILGLFLISGILRFVLPPLFDIIPRIALMCLGVVVAYRALDGEIPADSSFIVRLIIAIVVTIVSYLLFVVALFAFLGLALSELTWLALGSLVLFPLGLYIYIRLFLSTPAVMIGDDGPIEALSASWRLTDGSILPTAGAIILVFIIGTIIRFSLSSQIQSLLIQNIGVTLILDTLLVALQAFLYSKLADTHGFPQP